MRKAKARLAFRTSADGTRIFKDEIPIGKEYEVDIDTLQIGTVFNKDSRIETRREIIYCACQDNCDSWLITECLEIQQGPPSFELALR